MSRRLLELTGAGFPLFAFSHCRDVVAVVSKAGGFGVFGVTPEEVETELAWIDAHVDGKPYGVDLLIPEVLRAIKGMRPVPVLAAGGIMTGRQMAGCMAMGAAGVWTGSVWLATAEAETSPVFREKMVAARSRDTIRSRGRTGKPARQLKSAGTEAWEGADSPGPLAMPLQGIVSEPAMQRVNRSAEAGNEQARALVSYFVGQGVGLVESIPSARQVVAAFMEEFAEALEDMPAS